jgi:ATP-dependent Clp protease protease subunit
MTTIELREPITDGALRRVVDELLAAEDEVTLRIDSPGGPTSTSLALRMLLRTSLVAVHTLCVGEAVGGAALVLASGAVGRRALLDSARVSLGHPASADAKTISTDDVILDDPLFFHELAAATGADRDALERLGDGRWLSAHEAVELGFADHVLPTLPPSS